MCSGVCMHWPRASLCYKPNHDKTEKGRRKWTGTWSMDHYKYLVEHRPEAVFWQPNHHRQHCTSNFPLHCFCLAWSELEKAAYSKSFLTWQAPVAFWAHSGHTCCLCNIWQPATKKPQNTAKSDSWLLYAQSLLTGRSWFLRSSAWQKKFSNTLCWAARSSLLMFSMCSLRIFSNGLKACCKDKFMK